MSNNLIIDFVNATFYVEILAFKTGLVLFGELIQGFWMGLKASSILMFLESLNNLFLLQICSTYTLTLNLMPMKIHVEIFFKFIYLFIYFWLCRVFVSVQGLSLVAASGGHSSSRCAGLSLSRPLLLRSTGSRLAGSVVVAHGPSCSAACGKIGRAHV